MAAEVFYSLLTEGLDAYACWHRDRDIREDELARLVH